VAGKFFSSWLSACLDHLRYLNSEEVRNGAVKMVTEMRKESPVRNESLFFGPQRSSSLIYLRFVLQLGAFSKGSMLHCNHGNRQNQIAGVGPPARICGQRSHFIGP
jgi:hypothetical protein